MAAYDWSALRTRRIITVAATLFILPGSCVAIPFDYGGTVWLVGVVALASALHYLRAWPCPRCGREFTGKYTFPYVRPYCLACLHCGLPGFTPTAVEAPPFMPPVEREKRRRWSPKRWMRIIGIWQIVGGGATIAFFLDFLRSVPRDDTVALDIFAAAILVAIVAMVAGVGLVRGVGAALRPSLFVWALQLVGVRLGTAAYQLALGPYISLAVASSGNISADTGFKSSVTVRWGMATGQTIAAINLLACWAFWKLLRTKPQDMHDDARASDAQAIALLAPVTPIQLQASSQASTHPILEQ